MSAGSARLGFVRCMLLPGLAGAVAGLAALAGLLVLDIGALRSLILASDAAWLAGGLLASGFVVTFGSAAIGAAVMALGDD